MSAHEVGEFLRARKIVDSFKSTLIKLIKWILFRIECLKNLSGLSSSSERGGVELSIPWLGKINVDPPVILVARTKAQAARILALNQVASPWRSPLGRVVVASAAKTLSAVADRRIKTHKIILMGNGTLERAIWAMATADGLNVMTLGFTFAAEMDNFHRVGRAIRHWINRGGNFSAFSALTGIKEELIPSEEKNWFILSPSIAPFESEKVEETAMDLIFAGIEPRAAREIACFHLVEEDELRKLRRIADTIGYHYPDRAEDVASLVARILNLNEHVLRTYLSLRI